MVMATYSLNMFIHAIMYSYYFASLFMRENQFVAVKKVITIMQMVSQSKDQKLIYFKIQLGM